MSEWLERHAEIDRDEDVRRHALDAAARCRDRARAARMRADKIRSRLADEGVDPGAAVS